MSFTLTVLEADFERLNEAVFSAPGREGAAYLICGRSETAGETRLLVRDVIPVRDEHYLVREADRLSIDSASDVPVAKRARDAGTSIVFAHSHPVDVPDFSRQDDREEPKLHAFLQGRAPGVPHGSLVVSGPDAARGRVWIGAGWAPAERVRVIGRRFRFIDRAGGGDDIAPFFDRQVRAFGPDVQRLLRRLHVAVVGAGGTGSAVVEELARLGVGTLSLFDGDTFDPTNVNRVYGSGAKDAGRYKVEVAADNVARMGLDTTVHPYRKHITDLETARHLRHCDLAFGCTDRHAPRGLLVQLSLRYLIPVFDTGVKIDSEGGVIRGIFGRITTLMPGEACLFCRQRITPKMIQLESLSPEERQTLADEDYAPELETAAPAVIPFTTAVAAQAVSEMLHRLTGFMGPERQSSEVLMQLSGGGVKTNRLLPSPECLCSLQAEVWGAGDTKRFLGISWTTPLA